MHFGLRGGGVLSGLAAAFFSFYLSLARIGDSDRHEHREQLSTGGFRGGRRFYGKRVWTYLHAEWL